MSKDKKEDANEGAAAPAKPKGRRKLPLILAAVVLLLGGVGGGAYWWVARASASGEAAEPEHAEASHAEPAGVIALQPFLVNLTDKEASRFLRVTLSLAVSDKTAAEEIAEDPVHMTRIRSTILEFLALQTSEAVVTPEGKETLKKAIAERVSKVLTEVQVVDVLFSEFVVQF
jgi:flagellar FliL protein